MMRSIAVATPHNSPCALRAMHTACSARSFARSASGIARWRIQNSTSSACSSGVTFRQTSTVSNATSVPAFLRATSVALLRRRSGHLRLRRHAHEFDVLAEVQRLVLVLVERRQHRRALTRVLHEREVGVFARVQPAVVVGVVALELHAQALHRERFERGVVTGAELVLRQTAVLVLVPRGEGGVGAEAGLLRRPGGLHRPGRRGGRRVLREDRGCHRQQGDRKGDAYVHATTSCCVSGSKVISSRISAVRSPIIIGLTTPGRKLMSKISLMSPSKRIQLSTSPLVSDTICTPHQGSASRFFNSSSSCKPSKRWFRGFDSPTAATLPTIDKPRRKPGNHAVGTKALFSKST